jgi:hypothetical protein
MDETSSPTGTRRLPLHRRALWCAVLLLSSASCAKKRAPASPLEQAMEIRRADLSAEQEDALDCALQIGREKHLLKNAVPTAVTKGGRLRGPPPDSGVDYGWTVRFVEKDLTPESRDGSFTITVQARPCRADLILVPG